MKIDLVEDAEQVNLILNDRSVRPHIGGNGNTYVDATVFCEDENSYVFLCSDENGIGACFIFTKITTIIYDGHIAALPHFRGKRMMKATRLVFDYMLSRSDCHKITGRIPVTNKSANAFVSRIGFDHEGVCRNSVFVDDKLVDQNYWGAGEKTWV